MTSKKFITTINWRQILIHFLAFWFFIHAFEILSFLHYIKLVNIGRLYNFHNDKILAQNNISTSDLSDFAFWTNTSGFIGLLVAFVFSLVISLKQHWFWINSFIVLCIAYALYRFDLLGWTYLKVFFLAPGQALNNTTWEFLVNGSILLILGLLVFFLKRVNRFIDNKNFQLAEVVGDS